MDISTSKRSRKSAISIEQQNALRLIRQTRNSTYTPSENTDINETEQTIISNDDDDDDDDDTELENVMTNTNNVNENISDDNNNRPTSSSSSISKQNNISQHKKYSLHDSFKKRMKLNSIEYYSRMNNSISNSTNNNYNMDNDELLNSLLQKHAATSPKPKRPKFSFNTDKSYAKNLSEGKHKTSTVDSL